MAITLDGVVAPERRQGCVRFQRRRRVELHLRDARDRGYHAARGRHAPGIPQPLAGRADQSNRQPERAQVATMAARTPHFVLSRTLREVEWPNATVLTGGVDGIADLKKQAGRDIVLWGGPTAAAAAIEAGVVDEYHLVSTRHCGRRQETVRQRRRDAPRTPSGHQDVSLRHRYPQIRARVSRLERSRPDVKGCRPVPRLCPGCGRRLFADSSQCSPL